ncbi:putative lipoate--protein ligase [Helianthus anomalus]
MATRHVAQAGCPPMNIVRMKGVPILQQLEIEECLLRTSSDNWCIINDGVDRPNIVMGISRKPAELVEIKRVLEDNIPVIRRFTGGGTVIVDLGTIFVSFICNKDEVAECRCTTVFEGIADFRLRENDIGPFCYGNSCQFGCKRYQKRKGFILCFSKNDDSGWW